MKKNTIYLNLNILAVSFVLLLGCTKSTNDTEITADSRITAAGAPATNPHLVVITNSAFNPVRTEVVIGTMVTWVNQDNAVHTVSSYDDSFDSGDIQPGRTFSYTPAAPGTKAYRCRYHDRQAGELVAGMIK